jgi:hypothetical protein
MMSQGPQNRSVGSQATRCHHGIASYMGSGWDGDIVQIIANHHDTILC